MRRGIFLLSTLDNSRWSSSQHPRQWLFHSLCTPATCHGTSLSSRSCSLHSQRQWTIQQLKWQLDESSLWLLRWKKLVSMGRLWMKTDELWANVDCLNMKLREMWKNIRWCDFKQCMQLIALIRLMSCRLVTISTNEADLTAQNLELKTRSNLTLNLIVFYIKNEICF